MAAAADADDAAAAAVVVASVVNLYLPFLCILNKVRINQDSHLHRYDLLSPLTLYVN